MSNGASTQYDVVIIGAGVSGNLIAKQLGLAGKKVLILEAGLPVPDSREEYMNNFYLALAKTPVRVVHQCGKADEETSCFEMRILRDVLAGSRHRRGDPRRLKHRHDLLRRT